MHSCEGYVTLPFIQSCFKFVRKFISGHGLSVGVNIFSSPVEFPFYTLPVGFPIDGEFKLGLGVFLKIQ